MFKKGGYLIFILTFSSFVFLWVFFLFFLFFVLFTPYLSVFFVFHASWEEHNLIKSNQQIAGSYKSVYFEKQKHCGTLSSKFFCIREILIQWSNTDSCCQHITGGVNIYLHECVSVLALVSAVCPCLCVWYQIRVLAQIHIMC